MQLDQRANTHTGGGAGSGSSVWGAARRVWRHEGWGGFYKGLAPSLMRSCTFSAIRLYVQWLLHAQCDA